MTSVLRHLSTILRSHLAVEFLLGPTIDARVEETSAGDWSFFTIRIDMRKTGDISVQ